MRTSIKALLASTLFVAVATPAMADETAPPSDIKITGSAAVVSQYRFRGIAQSDNKPAVQGAITISHSSGFYVSTWGSSATAGNSAVNIGGTEIDVYGGFAHALGSSGINADVGVYGYLYPGAPGGNYYEVYGSLSGAVGPVNAKAGVNFAPAQKNLRIYPTHSNTYVYGELSGAIPNTPLTVHSHLGHTGGAFDWTKQYLDYSVGVGATYKNLTLDVSWVGTNVGKKDAALKPVTSSFETYRAAKDVAVVSLTATF
ncbi:MULTISPECIES: TorF family putative porin [Novosphingobium]|uniref:TorF family putative porin n=1 Tax=Novosphingobium TaxID=165696 RepID=UPI001CD43CF5|nr:TorF family putative porin [Novosphingobium percolationis]